MGTDEFNLAMMKSWIRGRWQALQNEHESRRHAWEDLVVDVEEFTGMEPEAAGKMLKRMRKAGEI